MPLEANKGQCIYIVHLTAQQSTPIINPLCTQDIVNSWVSRGQYVIIGNDPEAEYVVEIEANLVRVSHGPSCSVQLGSG